MQTESKQINELIRGEIAAVKSYETVIPKIKNSMEKEKLTGFKNDHQMAVEKLKQFATDIESTKKKATPWASFATAFAGGASFFGDKVAVKALQFGEQHGLNEYKDALKDPSIPQEAAAVIRSQLLPNQEKHISAIRGLIQ